MIKVRISDARTSWAGHYGKIVGYVKQGTDVVRMKYRILLSNGVTIVCYRELFEIIGKEPPVTPGKVYELEVVRLGE